MKKSILILGATSSIACAIAAAFAAKGMPLYLASRDEKELERIASNLSVRYQVDVDYGTFDATKTKEHQAFLEKVIQKTNGIEGVVMTFGELGDHQKALEDYSEVEQILAANFTGSCSILHHFASYLEKKKEGFIIGFSSVAGDRGRQSNYIYGAAKGGLSIYLQGLRNRLHSSGVHVMTVKPGFVDTAMTYGKQGMFLVANPETIGKSVVEALEK